MTPPEYCHSCIGEGVCADTMCEKLPHMSSTTRRNPNERSLSAMVNIHRYSRHPSANFRCHYRACATSTSYRCTQISVGAWLTVPGPSGAAGVLAELPSAVCLHYFNL